MSSCFFPTMSVAVTVTSRPRCRRGLNVVPSLLRNWPREISRFSAFSIRCTVDVNGGAVPTGWMAMRMSWIGLPALFVMVMNWFPANCG